MIRVEDHNTLRSNVLNILEMHEEFPNELETHGGKVNLISSELLRAFLHEFYSFTHERSSFDQLTSHALSAAIHYCPNIASEALELRDTATKNQTRF